MNNSQTLGILSMSLASVASGAFASIGENVLDKTPDNLGIDSNISLHKSTSVDGVRYAKRYSPSFIGSAVSSSNDPNGTSSVESCYSNCHDNPICEDYSKGTTCPTGYTKDICADDSSFWNCTCHTDTVQQCIDANFTKTSCSTGYTLSGQCPDNTAYYSSCTCHTDCTEMYQDAMESRNDSFDMFASDLDWSGTVVEATGITGSGAVSISTVPWYTSLSAAQQIINATAADLATYNNACSASLTWSCYSNCHTEVVDCPGYVTAQGVPVITDDASFVSAMTSSSSIIAVLDNRTFDHLLNISNKKLVGPKYFTGSSVCTALETPTLTVNNGDTGGIKIGTGGGIDNLKISYATTLTSGASAVYGSGSLSNVSISTSENTLKEYAISPTGDIDIIGPVTITTAETSDYGVNIDTGARMDVSSSLAIYGGGNYSAYIQGTMNISSTGSYTSNVASYYDVNVGTNGQFIANGTVKILGNPSYAIKSGYSSGTATVTLAGSNNKLTGTYVGIYSTDGTVNISGTTTIALTSAASKALNLHEVYSGSNVVVNISAPVTITGLQGNNGDEYTYDDDLIAYMVGSTINLTSSITSTTKTGFSIYGGASVNMNSSGAAISGVDYFTMSYSTSVMKVVSGAKLTVGSTCKKATSTKTYTGEIAKTPTPPTSIFAGSC